MRKKLTISPNSAEIRDARFGGAALIDGITIWPTAPNGNPLTLLMSIPANFLLANTGIKCPSDFILSVFSYYSREEYFLDYIVYHGDPAELSLIKQGYTKVVLHPVGGEITEGTLISPVRLEADSINLDKEKDHANSYLGGLPSFLQNEKLQLNGLDFVLQLYAGDLPEPYKDVFYLSDAVGYIFAPATSDNSLTEGLLFAQAT